MVACALFGVVTSWPGAAALASPVEPAQPVQIEVRTTGVFDGQWVRPDIPVSVEVAVDNGGADLVGAKATGSCQFFRTISPSGSVVFRTSERWTWGCAPRRVVAGALDVSIIFLATEASTGQAITPEERTLHLVVSTPAVRVDGPRLPIPPRREGGQVEYELEVPVTNTGNSPLSSVTVTDSLGGAAEISMSPAPIAPGQQVLVSHTVTLAAVADAPVTVSVNGVDPTGVSVASAVGWSPPLAPSVPPEPGTTATSTPTSASTSTSTSTTSPPPTAPPPTTPQPTVVSTTRPSRPATTTPGTPTTGTPTTPGTPTPGTPATSTSPGTGTTPSGTPGSGTSTETPVTTTIPTSTTTSRTSPETTATETPSEPGPTSTPTSPSNEPGTSSGTPSSAAPTSNVDDPAVASTTVAGDGVAIELLPGDTPQDAISWSTRVATILGGALFGLALAGFGWVYVSATHAARRNTPRR